MRWPVTSSWADAALTVAAGVAILAVLLLLAGCRLLSGGFDTAAGGPPRTALVTVDNPFWPPECPTCDR